MFRRYDRRAGTCAPALLDYQDSGVGQRHFHLDRAQAWSPIGGVNRYFFQNPERPADPLSHPILGQLASKYSKTPAQVVLRWQVEIGNSPIPKSVHAERIAENIDIFDFELTHQEIVAIDALDLGKRGGPDPELVSPKLYDFKIQD